MLKNITRRFRYIMLLPGCLILLLCKANAQNLVPNADFESDSIGYCSWVTDPAHFSDAFKYWTLPTYGTSDYFSMKSDSTCYSHPFSKDTFNRQGAQMPHSGINMAGMSVYGTGCIDTKPNYREYIQIKLKEPLIPGKTYITGLFASLSDSSTYGIKGLGFYFSDVEVTHYVECEMLHFTPQTVSSQYITDTQNWVKICETFVANSAAQYLIIGNFKNDSATDIKPIRDTSTGNKHAYYFIDDVFVRPQQDVVADLGPDIKKCVNATAELDAGIDSADFVWHLPNGKMVPGRKLYAQDTGLYILKALQCDTLTLDSIHIGNYPAPQANAGPDSAICYGQSIQLSGSGGVKYLWSPAEFLDDPTLQKPTSNTPVSRNYILTITDAFGCTSSDTVQLVVRQQLQIATNQQITLCEGDTVSLSATTKGGIPDQHKLYWIAENGDTLFTGTSWKYAPKENQTLTVLLDDNCSEPFSLQVEIMVNKKPVAGFTQNPPKGCAPLVVQFLANETSTEAKYEWDFGDGTTSAQNNPAHIYTIPGKYLVTLKITFPNGCSVTSFAADSIAVFPNPVAGFSHLVENPGGHISNVKFENYSTGANAVSWFIDEQEVSAEQAFTHQLEAGKEYTVKLVAKNKFGCTDTSEAKISFAELYSIYIPNVFTPNNDGQNNTFKPVGLGIASYNLQIYSRWGELLYEGQEWDGSYKGKAVQEGIYLYIINALANDKRRYYYNGTVNIIK